MAEKAMTDPQTPRPARKPVKTARLYQSVAEQIARSVAAGDYKPGDRLPSERELSQSYSVSRPTVREAIIALELDGLVEVRHASGEASASERSGLGGEEFVPWVPGAMF